MVKYLFISIIILCTALFAVNWDTVSDDTWMQVPTSGTCASRGGDIHAAVDKDGMMYIIGGCTYGNGAGGSHNADIYRINLLDGSCSKIMKCGDHPWKGGCQAAQAYDSKRHCVWFNNGAAPTCGSGSQGLFRLQCPNGPITKVTSSAPSGHYMMYDAARDQLVLTNKDNIQIYDIVANSTSTVQYPWGCCTITGWDMPVCIDTKRDLLVVTLVAPYSVSNPAAQVEWDMHFYNLETGQWSTKTPPLTPQIYKGELTYDIKSDRYVYFGGACPSELWYYDYEYNNWTKVQPSGRAYNDGNPSASTWPPARHKHAWEYCEKYNIHVNWMGGQWADNACTEYDNGVAHPLWIYRLSKDGLTGKEESGQNAGMQEPVIGVYPNPFNGTIAISCPPCPPAGEAGQLSAVSKVKLEIFNINGKLVKDFSSSIYLLPSTFYLQAAGLSPGIYILKVQAGHKQYTKRLVLQ